MIPGVDAALQRAVRAAVPDTAVAIVLDAPTREWAASRSSPTIDLYLHDLQEMVEKRQAGRMPVRSADDRISGHRMPQRWFRMHYLLSCWTSKTEDEHALLTACLMGLLAFPELPAEWLGPGAADGCTLEIAQPDPGGRRTRELWTALGGDLRPSLDVVVQVALDAGVVAAGPAVTEPPVLVVHGPEQTEIVRGRQR